MFCSPEESKLWGHFAQQHHTRSFYATQLFSWTWAGSFLSSNFRKVEGIQKSVKIFVSWFSTSRSLHPCVVEIAHTFGSRQGIEATSRRKFCSATSKVSQKKMENSKFWGLKCQRQTCQDLDFTKKSETTSRSEKLSTELPWSLNPSQTQAKLFWEKNWQQSRNSTFRIISELPP